MLDTSKQTYFIIIVEGDNMRIMIIEDDRVLGNEIKLYCEKWGLEVVCATKFHDLCKEVEVLQPHLILLDINLPYFDGFYWCEKIRKNSTVPILFISSRDGNQDKIMAITTGGDDYIQKPFALDYLMAKIQAMLRRTYEYQDHVQMQLSNDLQYDFSQGLLRYHHEVIELTKMENRILAILLKSRGKIVSREELMMQIWSTDEFISDGSLTTSISRLKSKIRQETGVEDIIITKKGQGYLIP